MIHRQSIMRRIYQTFRYEMVSRVLRTASGNVRLGKSALFLPTLMDMPETARVLSISPHPDDDVLAIGGILAGHAASQSEIISLILTNGSRGNSETVMDQKLTVMRRQEADAAARIIGISYLHFWDIEDGQLRSDPEQVSRMEAQISAFMPDLIYLPFPIDYHYDHLAATRLVLEALRKLRTTVTLRCYECIVPLIPNRICDVTRWIEKKRAAIRCYVSQNRVTDYEYTIIEGLNKLRTHGLMKGRGYAEGLFETDMVSLHRILRAMD